MVHAIVVFAFVIAVVATVVHAIVVIVVFMG